MLLKKAYFISVRPADYLLAFLAPALVPLALSASLAVDFQDLTLGENTYWNGSEGVTSDQGFSSRGAQFNNRFTDEFGFDSWSGWAYSNVLDQDTRGFGNQYAAIAGSGTGDNGIYAVAYMDSFTPVFPRIDLPDDAYPVSMTISNTTYVYYSMLEGDAFTDAFSTADGGDWFRLDIQGLDAGGEETGVIEFYLADFRFADEEEAYILNEWTELDLSALGQDTRSLRFALSSSDVGDFGMNTPSYFAMGDLVAVPEPATAALVFGLLAGVLGFYSRRQRQGGAVSTRSK